MSTSKTLAFALLLGTSVIGVYAQSDAQTKPPDNSAVNKGNAPTADNQKMNPADRQMTAQIRKSIVNDKTLSTYAHNIKIIAQDGTVTLKGPVRSDDEVRSCVAKATEVAGGSDKVINQLEVKPRSTNK
jgi:hyperosmotically inducible periplasmic protein